MKKIGLIGGTGPESTVMYYKELNSRIDTITNGKAMPDIVIESVDFRKAWNLVCAGQYSALSNYLAEKIICLKNSGAEVIALTSATMHVVFEQIVQKSNNQLVSIPKTVTDKAIAMGISKVCLLGTIFTMEQDYMKKDMVDAGIQVVVPTKNERNLVAKRIFEELENGIVKESTLNEFVKIIERMRDEEGVEAVVLGCTELPLLLNTNNCPVCCLNAAEIHISKLIDLACADCK